MPFTFIGNRSWWSRWCSYSAHLKILHGKGICLQIFQYGCITIYSSWYASVFFSLAIFFYNMGIEANIEIYINIFFSIVHIWRSHRKVLNTTFNLKILQSFIPIFNEKVKCLVCNLEDKLNDDYFDITPMLHACSLEMVCGKKKNYVDCHLDLLTKTNFLYFNSNHSRSWNWSTKWEKCWLCWSIGEVCDQFCNFHFLSLKEYTNCFIFVFRYLAGVAKRTFNIFYHFDFIYKRSALYVENCKYTEIADRLPCNVYFKWF